MRAIQYCINNATLIISQRSKEPQTGNSSATSEAIWNIFEISVTLGEHSMKIPTHNPNI